MNNRKLVINGHYEGQRITGVQRYAIEVLNQFKESDVSFRVASPPQKIRSQAFRHLWMQAVLPLKLKKDELLWSPTNLGPVLHTNQVVTLHDIADQLHPEWYSRQYVSWRSVFLPRLLSKVKGIITVSEYSRKTIEERFPQAEGKIRVIDNGIDKTHFYPRDTEEQKAMAVKYQLNKPYAITVASLDPRKNIEGVIRAWHELPQTIRKEMDLVILGGHADIFSFKLDLKIDPSVRFLGYVNHEDLPQLYSGARYFVYPSLFEGFGLPVLEAMACQTPVITSNNTSLHELVKGHALTVNPNDTTAITEAMHTLIESDELCAQLGQTGYRYVQSFSWEKTARETLEMLDQVGS